MKIFEIFFQFEGSRERSPASFMHPARRVLNTQAVLLLFKVKGRHPARLTMTSQVDTMTRA